MASRGEPDVGGGQHPGHVVDRDAAVKRDPVRDAELVGLGAERRLGIAAAVEVEDDIEVGPRLGDPWRRPRSVTSSSYVGVSAPV